MLPYEPLLKIIHSEIKCYERKIKKKIKTGEIYNYASKQYVITLKNDQPFSCNQRVTIIRSEDYFRMNKLLQQKKKDYEEYLERIIMLEKELKQVNQKLNHYEDIEVDIKLRKLNRLEKEILELEAENEKINKNLIQAKADLESKDQIIKELNEKRVFHKIGSFFGGKNDK